MTDPAMRKRALERVEVLVLGLRAMCALHLGLTVLLVAFGLLLTGVYAVLFAFDEGVVAGLLVGALGLGYSALVAGSSALWTALLYAASVSLNRHPSAGGLMLTAFVCFFAGALGLFSACCGGGSPGLMAGMLLGGLDWTLGLLTLLTWSDAEVRAVLELSDEEAALSD